MATRPNQRLPAVRAGIYTRISAGHLRTGCPLLAITEPGGVDQLPEHAVAPAAVVDAVLASRNRRRREGIRP